jgi:N-methylhydantoinase A/oxoprolinase/acetone carboxylase beta subunit
MGAEQVSQVSLYEREALQPGAEMAGAALIFQLDSTVFIPAGWSARVDGYRNLLLEHNYMRSNV